VLALTAEGRSDAAIAHEVVTGDGAVAQHIRNVLLDRPTPVGRGVDP